MTRGDNRQLYDREISIQSWSEVLILRESADCDHVITSATICLILLIFLSITPKSIARFSFQRCGANLITRPQRSGGLSVYPKPTHETLPQE